MISDAVTNRDKHLNITWSISCCWLISRFCLFKGTVTLPSNPTYIIQLPGRRADPGTLPSRWETVNYRLNACSNFGRMAIIRQRLVLLNQIRIKLAVLSMVYLIKQVTPQKSHTVLCYWSSCKQTLTLFDCSEKVIQMCILSRRQHFFVYVSC